jgi:hypothetical protein
MKAPNEKLIEILFTHYALRYLDGCGIRVYTPSSREEYVKGYDAKLMGACGFSELFIQFKTPNVLHGLGYSFPTRAAQHQRLRYYPKHTAFYVSHTFWDVQEIQKAQQLATPAEFLRRYVAIEVRCLEDDVRRFRYYAQKPPYKPAWVRYKRGVDGTIKYPQHSVDPAHWMLGDELLNRFRSGSVGAWVLPFGVDDEYQTEDAGWPDHESQREWLVTKRLIEQMSGRDKGIDWGTALRKDFKPLAPVK